MTVFYIVAWLPRVQKLSHGSSSHGFHKISISRSHRGSQFPDHQSQTVKSDRLRLSQKLIKKRLKKKAVPATRSRGRRENSEGEVMEVLYTWTSGMVRSRSIQNHRAKDLPPPPGSVSSVSLTGHFRRLHDERQKCSAPNHHSTWAFFWQITGSGPV